jgi:hypothetical protein
MQHKPPKEAASTGCLNFRDAITPAIPVLPTNKDLYVELEENSPKDDHFQMNLFG